MNTTEKKLTLLAGRMKDRGHLASVKAEFAAEGTRCDELLRLVDIIRTHSILLTLKIGGCEAVKDLYEARQFGARFIVAPMIESAYALEKYEQSINKVYPKDEMQEARFLFNLETILAYQGIEQILNVANASKVLSGVVFGRTDFSGSLGIKDDVQKNKQVTDAALDLADRLSGTQLDFVLGGEISIASLPVLKMIASKKLTRFETRKVVFYSTSLVDPLLAESLLDAVHFEILWLLNKSQYYGALQKEDIGRIEKLENRWRVLGREL